MQKTKLIEILKTLNTRQRTRFQEYVDSPFFNKHSKIRALSQFLLKYAPNFEHQNLNKTIVYQHLFPKTTYKESKFYNLSSDLLQLLNQYLAQIQYEQQPLLQKEHCLKSLRELNIERQYQTVCRQYELQLKKTPQGSLNTLLNQVNYYEEQNRASLLKTHRKYDKHLQLKSDHLDIYYLANKLQIACDMHNRNSIIQSNYNCWELDATLKLVDKHFEQLQQHPSIAIYYAILQMLRTHTDEDYQTVKTILAQNLNQFSSIELKSMYDYAINFCIQKLNTGQTNYYREFFDLHQFLLQKNILLEEGYLSEWDYKNIVTVGLRLGEYTTIEQFIWGYKDKINEQVRDNIFSFNLASFYYATQQYQQALQLLHQVEFTDSSYYLGAKIIQLKSYYELDELEAALSLLATFRVFIQRNKALSEYRQKTYTNMLKMSKKIILLQQKSSILSKTKLQKEKASLSKHLQ
ncbi:MAG: hypothetical protein GY810_32250, partial [Aureispira sp.]|nr:hypothetical protein [Aureispira sp.]